MRMSDLCLCVFEGYKILLEVTKRHKLRRDKGDTECDDNQILLLLFNTTDTFLRK